MAEETFACPQCQTPMINMGHLFCPPRRQDKRAWEQKRLMAEQGIRFYWGMDALVWEKASRNVPSAQRSVG